MADRIFKLQFLGDASQAIREMNKLGQNMTGAQKAMVGAGLAVGAAVGAVATKGFFDAITVAAEYEKAIDAVAATAKATSAETKAIWDTGLRIGKETTFSATEAASAMEELAAGGLSVKQILGGAADATVALAASASVDLTSAANLVGRAMNVWKLEQRDLNDVVNRGAAVALESSFNAADLGLAIGQGGGVAAAAGVSWKDFATAITLTASSFNSGSDAGTSFKQFLNGLTPNAAKARKEMAALGLITANGNQFFDAAGGLKSMAEITELLNTATKDLTEEQRAASLEIIFGSDAMRMAAALAGFTRKEFEALDATMGGTDAADIAAQRLGNAAGAMEQLRGSIETIQIELGSKFLPIIAKVASALAEFLPKIPTEVLLGAGAVMVLVGAFSALALALLPMVALGAALGIGLGTLVVTFGAVAVAITAAVTASILLWQNWDRIIAKAQEVGTAIANAPVIGGGLKAAAGVPGVGGLAKGLTYAIPGLGPIASAGASIIGMGLPQYANGGVVPGTGPQLAVVHGGETITPRGGGSPIINISLGSFIGDEAALQRAILSALHMAQQRGSLGIA